MFMLTCPRCQSSCSTETYEGIEVDRCRSCKGLWLDPGELEEIVETESEKHSESLIGSVVKLAKAGVPADQQKEKLPCPICKQGMQVINYAYNSGIIINRCAEDGIWLDSGELMQIEAYREHVKRLPKPR